MKNNKKHRVYFFEYLWWLGEKEHERKNGMGKMDGPMMFMFYYYILILVPILLLLKDYLSGIFISLIFGFLVLLFLLWMFWIHKFVYTKERRRAVMEHFSSKRYKPLQTYFFFLLPFLIAVFVMLIYFGTRPQKSIQIPLLLDKPRTTTLTVSRKFPVEDAHFLWG